MSSNYYLFVSVCEFMFVFHEIGNNIIYVYIYIMKYYERFFYVLVNIILVTYVLVGLGIWSYYPEYLRTLEMYQNAFICIVLLLVYNPVYSIAVSETFLRKVGFSAGIAIGLNLFQSITTSFTLSNLQ